MTLLPRGGNLGNPFQVPVTPGSIVLCLHYLHHAPPLMATVLKNAFFFGIQQKNGTPFHHTSYDAIDRDPRPPEKPTVHTQHRGRHTRVTHKELVHVVLVQSTMIQIKPCMAPQKCATVAPTRLFHRHFYSMKAPLLAMGACKQATDEAGAFHVTVLLPRCNFCAAALPPRWCIMFTTVSLLSSLTSLLNNTLQCGPVAILPPPPTLSRFQQTHYCQLARGTSLHKTREQAMADYITDLQVSLFPEPILFSPCTAGSCQSIGNTGKARQCCPNLSFQYHNSRVANSILRTHRGLMKKMLTARPCESQTKHAGLLHLLTEG